MGCKRCGSVNCYKNGFGNGKRSANARIAEETSPRATDAAWTGRKKRRSATFSMRWAGPRCVFLPIFSRFPSGRYYVWIKDMADATPDSEVEAEIKEIEIDESGTIFQKKSQTVAVQGV